MKLSLGLYTALNKSGIGRKNHTLEVPRRGVAISDQEAVEGQVFTEG